MMYLLTRKNRVIDYCESGYIYVGNSVVCEEKGCTFLDATIVYTDKPLPDDIDSNSYEYLNGEFVKVDSNVQDYIVTVGDMLVDFEGYPHDYTIRVEGIRHTDTPIADVVLGEDVDANKLYLKAWSCITRITTAENSITLYTDEAVPSTSFKIHLKVVR